MVLENMTKDKDMKKSYDKPTTEVVKLNTNIALLQASGDPYRYVPEYTDDWLQ